MFVVGPVLWDVGQIGYIFLVLLHWPDPVPAFGVGASLMSISHVEFCSFYFSCALARDQCWRRLCVGTDEQGVQSQCRLAFLSVYRLPAASTVYSLQEAWEGSCPVALELITVDFGMLGEVWTWACVPTQGDLVSSFPQ